MTPNRIDSCPAPPAGQQQVAAGSMGEGRSSCKTDGGVFVGSIMLSSFGAVSAHSRERIALHVPFFL